jgi:dolichol-phosphate mannosyltransferase
MLVDVLGFRAVLSAGWDLAAAHLIGFFAAAAFNYVGNALWSFRAVGQGRHTLAWGECLRFLFVAVLGLSLRGGVLALAMRAGLRPEAALLLAIFAAAAVNYLGSAFYVFGKHGVREGSSIRWRAAAVALALYVLVLRLVFLGLPALLVEEAYYWNYAQHPSLGYLDHPPMVAWLIQAGTSILGNTELGVRAPAFLCSLVTIACGVVFARNLHGRSAALRTVLLLTALPFFFVTGFIMTPDAPLLAAWAATLVFLERALRGGQRVAWYGAGLCLGLGLLSKYTILLLVPATLVFILLDRPSRAWLLRPEPYVAVLLALFVFMPVVVWNAENGWASFVFQGPRRMEAGHGFGLPRLAFSIVLVVGPIVPLALLEARAWRRKDRSRLFEHVFLLVPLSVFALFSLQHTDIKLNWTGPIWLAILPRIAAETLRWQSDGTSRLRQRLARAWGPTLGALVAGYGLALQFLALGAPGIGYPDAHLFGWEDLAVQVERIEDQVEYETGSEPLVVGLDKYNIASQLAFYRTKILRHGDDEHRAEGVRETAGRHFFGKESLMYRYWHPVEEHRGRNMVLVADELAQITDDRVRSHFERVSAPIRIRPLEHGKQSTEFYVGIGYGFRSAGARDAAPLKERDRAGPVVPGGAVEGALPSGARRGS